MPSLFECSNEVGVSESATTGAKQIRPAVLFRWEESCRRGSAGPAWQAEPGGKPYTTGYVEAGPGVSLSAKTSMTWPGLWSRSFLLKGSDPSKEGDSPENEPVERMVVEKVVHSGGVNGVRASRARSFARSFETGVAGCVPCASRLGVRARVFRTPHVGRRRGPDGRSDGQGHCPLQNGPALQPVSILSISVLVPRSFEAKTMLYSLWTSGFDPSKVRLAVSQIMEIMDLGTDSGQRAEGLRSGPQEFPRGGDAPGGPREDGQARGASGNRSEEAGAPASKHQAGKRARLLGFELRNFESAFGAQEYNTF